jgi:hypothetical protein
MVDPGNRSEAFTEENESNITRKSDNYNLLSARQYRNQPLDAQKKAKFFTLLILICFIFRFNEFFGYQINVN